jgi:hypothetical protein
MKFCDEYRNGMVKIAVMEIMSMILNMAIPQNLYD